MPSGAVVACDASSGFFPLGTTTVTCTATDASGNVSSDSFHVTVVDTIPPEVEVALVPGRGVNDKGGFFRVEYACNDIVDDHPSITVATLNGVPVPNKQLVHLKLSDEQVVREGWF